MSTLKEISALLATVPAFSGVDASKLTLMAYLASSVEYRSGQTILISGARAPALFVVQSGTLERSDGRQTFETGALLGDVSILSGAPVPAEIIAKTKASVLRIDQSKFLELLNSTPDLSRAILRDMAQRLVRAEETANIR